MDRREAPAIPMSERFFGLLLTASRKRTLPSQYKERIGILLRASSLWTEGYQNNAQIKRTLGISINTVKSWRRRWMELYPKLLVFEQGKEGTGVSDSVLLQEILSGLDDLPRSGHPKRITLAQEQQIVALACRKPSEYGIEMTTWTHQMLAHVAISEGIITSISARYVGTILKKPL
jgi:transposase